MGVTSRTEPIVNYQEGQNIAGKDHKINKVTHQTDNTIMIYNETTKEVHIDKRGRIKAKSSSNRNTDKPDIHSAKLKQEISRKDAEQETRKTKIMNGVEENGKINEELKIESFQKRKTESESQEDLQKLEIIEGKQQQVEETTVQKEHHNISENIINKGMESKMTYIKITCNMSLNKQENTSQMKQQISDELIQENNHYTNIRKQRFNRKKWNK